MAGTSEPASPGATAGLLAGMSLSDTTSKPVRLGGCGPAPAADDIVSLPVGCSVTELVGEGAANAIFRLSLPSGVGDELKARFAGKLLRVQKEPLKPESPPLPYQELYDYWANTIKPTIIAQSQLRIDDDTSKEHYSKNPVKAPVTYNQRLTALLSPPRTPPRRATPSDDASSSYDSYDSEDDSDDSEYRNNDSLEPPKKLYDSPADRDHLTRKNGLNGANGTGGHEGRSGTHSFDTVHGIGDMITAMLNSGMVSGDLDKKSMLGLDNLMGKGSERSREHYYRKAARLLKTPVPKEERDYGITDELFVHHELVILEGSRILPALNACLDALEHTEKGRRDKYQGQKVVDARYGMLVEDMQAQMPGDYLLEFKPKWLAQSPNAPPNATRCRTCAISLKKTHEAALARHQQHISRDDVVHPGEPGPPDHLDSSSFLPRYHLCPLYLTNSTDIPAVSALSILLMHLEKEPVERDSHHSAIRARDRTGLLMALFDWTVSSKGRHLFETLRDIQTMCDPKGVLKAGPEDAEALGTAMTLRDCTVFVRCRLTGQTVDEDGRLRPIYDLEAKIADLDKKNVKGKWAAWKESAEMLQKFYVGDSWLDFLARSDVPCYVERWKPPSEGVDM